MAENVGVLWTTKIPSLSETADIQEALRLYHYGAPSGTGSGEYDITNSNTSNLINNSGVAYWLQSLSNRLDSTDTALTSTLKSSTFTAKGQLLSSSASSALSILDVGSDDKVLTADSSQASGLSWKTPAVTLTNAIVFSNKTISLGANTVSGTIAQFNTAITDADFATLDGIEILTNKTLTSPIINLSTDTASTTNGRFIWNSTNKKITIGDGTSITQDFPSSTLVTNSQTGTSYTLIATDKDKLVEMFNASAISLTIPSDLLVSSYPVGTQINVLQTGTGQVTLSGYIIATGSYFSGGAAAATTVLLSTWNPNFAIGQTIGGTGLPAVGTSGSILSNVGTASVGTGTFYYGGASAALSVIIREYRPNVANTLMTGSNIPALCSVTSVSNTTTDTATYNSGGASGGTSVIVKERLPLVIAGQRLSATGLTGNQTVSSIAEATIIASLAYSTGGGIGASTFALVANANVLVGQRVTGTGIVGNVYVSSVTTGATTVITLGQTPIVSGIGTVSYTPYQLTAAPSGNYAFYGATINFTPAANAQIAGSISITGTTVNFNQATTGQLSGTITFNGTQLTFSPAATSQISGTVTSYVTVNGSPGLKTRSQWSLITLIKRAANIWVATGDLVA